MYKQAGWEPNVSFFLVSMHRTHNNSLSIEQQYAKKVVQAGMKPVSLLNLVSNVGHEVVFKDCTGCSRKKNMVER